MELKYPIMGLNYGRGHFAICGGGGSLKSGIKNTVVRAPQPSFSGQKQRHG